MRKAKPSASVEHQASTYPCSWRFGVTDLLAPHQDFMQGDFYGDSLQGSIARKLLSNLSPNRPIGFETSIASDLRNYTAVKPAELLEAKAHAAIGDGAAFIFIDSVDPVGTVNPVVYERMSRIFSRTRVYDPFLGGDRVEDVALYASFFSKHDPADNGKRVDDPHLSGRIPHFDAITRSARTLIERHVPWGIASRRNLGELSRWKAVVLPGVLALGDDEADALRAYVAGGGRLYASRQASLVGTDGKRRPDYLLADVFGVSWKARDEGGVHLHGADRKGRAVFGDYTPAHPLGLFAPQAIAEARPGAEVLATITLPYTDPADPVHFTSIHNNPPGIATRAPRARRQPVREGHVGLVRRRPGDRGVLRGRVRERRRPPRRTLHRGDRRAEAGRGDDVPAGERPVAGQPAELPARPAAHSRGGHRGAGCASDRRSPRR